MWIVWNSLANILWLQENHCKYIMKLAPPCSLPFAQFEMHNRCYLWRVSRKLAKTPRGKRPFPYIRLLWGFKSTLVYSRSASIFQIWRAKFTMYYQVIIMLVIYATWNIKIAKLRQLSKRLGYSFVLLTPPICYTYTANIYDQFTIRLQSFIVSQFPSTVIGSALPLVVL